MRKAIFGVATACICLMVGVAAAPAPKAPSSSITLNVPSTQVAAFTGASSDATIFPAVGDWITFTVTFSKNVQNPRILINCYQDGELVYGEAGAYNQSFMLGGSGSIWVYEHKTEPADCVATLFYWSNQGGGQKFVALADTQFDAAGALE